MSVKSKKRKGERLQEKRSAWYQNWMSWYNREPSTSDIRKHAAWEDEEPVKPKWLVELEDGLGVSAL